jgi:hypothetical protein
MELPFNPEIQEKIHTYPEEQMYQRYYVKMQEHLLRNIPIEIYECEYNSFFQAIGEADMKQDASQMFPNKETEIEDHGDIHDFMRTHLDSTQLREYIENKSREASFLKEFNGNKWVRRYKVPLYNYLMERQRNVAEVLQKGK